MDHDDRWLSRWRRRSALRRSLARRDRLTAQLAELHRIRTLAAAAHRLVVRGWLQDAWIAVGALERPQPLTVSRTHRPADGPVVGACLVGSIIHAGGGPAAMHSQPVQRALDLTWHELCGDRRDPVRYCPPPAVRAAHVGELVRWNDSPARTVHDVTALLRSVERRAEAEVERVRRLLRAEGDQLGPAAPAEVHRASR